MEETRLWALRVQLAGNTATQTITSWKVDTVGIASANTIIEDTEETNTTNRGTFADNSTFYFVKVRTYDFCGLEIHYGGHSDDIQGTLTSTANCTGLDPVECASIEGCAVNEQSVCMPLQLHGFAVDNGDGTYESSIHEYNCREFILQASFNGTAIDADRGLTIWTLSQVY